MKIAMGCDPNAEEYKKEMIQYVRELGHEVTDFGSEDVIYAHVAQNVAEKVAAKEYDRGILFCGTGIGVMLAANKVKGAYAANVQNVYSAKRACLSNNCNVLCKNEIWVHRYGSFILSRRDTPSDLQNRI